MQRLNEDVERTYNKNKSVSFLTKELADEGPEVIQFGCDPEIINLVILVGAVTKRACWLKSIDTNPLILLGRSYSNSGFV